MAIIADSRAGAKTTWERNSPAIVPRIAAITPTRAPLGARAGDASSSPDCREHAELAEPTLSDDSEARGGNQRGQEQEDGGDGKQCERVSSLDLAADPQSPEARTAASPRSLRRRGALVRSRD